MTPLFPTVRAMEPRDAPEVAVLCRELGYERSVDDVHRWIVELGRDPQRRAAYVACIQDRVLGWIEVSVVNHLQSGPYGMIGGLVVKQGVRGNGVGRRLCEQAEAWSRQEQMSSVRVTSRTTRAEAHQFYRRCGFEDLKTSLVFEKKLPL